MAAGFCNIMCSSRGTMLAATYRCFARVTHLLLLLDGIVPAISMDLQDNRMREALDVAVSRCIEWPRTPVALKARTSRRDETLLSSNAQA